MANDIQWRRSHRLRVCHECNRYIRRGDRYAAWAEICCEHDQQSLANIQLIRIDRSYCEECGKLLAESLTTTEEEMQ